MTGEDDGEMIVARQRPALRLHYSKAAAGFETVRFDLEVSGEDSIKAKENMAWMIAQAKRLHKAEVHRDT